MPRSKREIRSKADEIVARNYRKHQNRRKRKAMADYERGGWKLTFEGMPDFIASRPFARFRAVWVPDKLGGFTMQQKRLQGIFKVQGFDVRTVNLNASNFCDPGQGKSGSR